LGAGDMNRNEKSGGVEYIPLFLVKLPNYPLKPILKNKNITIRANINSFKEIQQISFTFLNTNT